MKFEVNKIELITEETFSYYGIFDKNNNNWYEEQKKFREDTLKVMYDKDTLQVLSISRDVSLLAPTTVGDIVEEIKSEEEIELTASLFFVGGKIVNLKECEKIENGEVVFDRISKIEMVKKEFSILKDKKIKLGVEVKEGIYHPVRDTDKINLLIARGTIRDKQVWKFFDINGEPVQDFMTKDLIDLIMFKGSGILNGAIIGELKAIESLNGLSEEELKTLDISEYFEKFYRLNGGI